MSDLKSVQRYFQHFLFDQSSTEIKAEIEADVIAIDERLSIYADAYLLRLMKVLKKDFPALNILLGDKVFEQMTKRYIKHYPSSFHSIRWVGKDVANFLIQDLHYNTHTMPAELAKFEWQLSEAFDAIDNKILTKDMLLATPSSSWPQMRLNVVSSLGYGQVVWNTLAFWQKIEKTPRQLPLQSYYLVWRKQLNIQFREASLEEMLLIKEIEKGKNFAELCERLTEIYSPETASQVLVDILKKWVSDEILAEK